MAGNYLHLGIYQDRYNEAENLNAASNLPDLLVAVETGIGRVELQAFNGCRND
jgi:hypothetical protein